ncbi:uncharacterized protein BDV17DRAFT_292713 [Aspergillus undulatus]|uniref:uncharacterized protein n=1 Tax=Aspergillus undulatus TaxID=1810928 RepID=UPI003CCD418C
MSGQDPRPRLERAASIESKLPCSPFLPVVHEDAQEPLDLSPIFSPTIPKTEDIDVMDLQEANETHASGRASPSTRSLSRSFLVYHYQVEYEKDENDVPLEFLEHHVKHSLKEAINTPLRSPNPSEPDTVLRACPQPSSPGDTEPFPDLDPSHDQGPSAEYVARDELYSYAMGKVAEDMQTAHEVADTKYLIRGCFLTVQEETYAAHGLPMETSEDFRPCREISHYDHYCADHEANKLTLRQKISEFIFLRKDVPKTFRKRFLGVCNMVFDIENLFFRAKKWPKNPIPLMTIEDMRIVRSYAIEMVEYLSKLGGLIYHEKCEAERARALLAEVAGSSLPAFEIFKHMAEIVIEPQRFFEPVRLTEQSFFDLFFRFYDVFLYDDFHVMYNNYLVENMPHVSSRLQQTSYLLNTVYNIMIQIVRDYDDVCQINKDIGQSYIQPVLRQLSQRGRVVEEEKEVVAYPVLAVEVEAERVGQSDQQHEDSDEAAQAWAQTEVVGSHNTEARDSAAVNYLQSKVNDTQTNQSQSRVTQWVHDPYSSRRRVDNANEAAGPGIHDKTDDRNTRETETGYAVRDLVEDSYLPVETGPEAYFPSQSSHTMAVDGPSFDGPSFEDHRVISQQNYDSDSDGADTEVMSSGEFNYSWARCKEAERERLAGERAAAAAEREEILDLDSCLADIRGSSESFPVERSQTLTHELSHVSAAALHTLGFVHNDTVETEATEVDPIQVNMIDDYFKNIQGPIYSTHTETEVGDPGIHVFSPSVEVKHQHNREQALDAEFNFLDLKDDDEDWLPHDWDHDQDRPQHPGFHRYDSNSRTETEPEYVSVKTFAGRLEEMAEARVYSRSRTTTSTSTDAQYNTPCFAARRASSASEEQRTGFPQYESVVGNDSSNGNNHMHIGRDGADSPLLPPFPEYDRRVSDLERKRELARERCRARRLASISRSHVRPLPYQLPADTTVDQGGGRILMDAEENAFPALNLSNPMHAVIAVRMRHMEAEHEHEREREHHRERQREQPQQREQHRPSSSFFSLNLSFGRSRVPNRPRITVPDPEEEEFPLAFARTSPNGSKGSWWRR